MLVGGGKSIYGASVGILMLETRFPRILGDMGNAGSFPFPVHYRVVRGASPDLVVRRNAEGLKDAFIEAARELVADGVDGVTTNCGFLSLFQEALSDSVPVPVLSSSLMQVEMVNRILPRGKRAGILTVSASTLSSEHLARANVPEGTPIGSTEEGREFSRVILNDEPTMNVDLARRENVEAATALLRENPDLGAIVLECTNMSPFAADIAEATKLPTYSMLNLVRWFQSSLEPQRYATSRFG